MNSSRPFATRLGSVLIATFSPWDSGKRGATNGMVEPMLDYFCPKTHDVVLIDQPYPGSDRIIPIIERYKNNKLQSKTNSFITSILLYPFLLFWNTSGTHIAFKLRDMLSVLEAVIGSWKRFDLFIGMESVNCLIGIFLKRLGLVSTVVYYVSDFSPIRYTNKIYNKLYLWLDRFACTHTDFIWDVSKAMHPTRIAIGLEPNKSAPVIHVPNGLFSYQIRHLSQAKRQKHSLVYAGTLGAENGPDLALYAFVKILKRIPDATLHVYGGSKAQEEALRVLAKELKIFRNVRFYGLITSLRTLSKHIEHYQIGLAPYRSFTGSPRLFGDATKIRLYLGASLPVIATDVAPLAKELALKRCVLIAEETPQAFASTIIKLLTNKRTLYNATTRARQYAKTNTWEYTYSRALHAMGFN